MIHLIYNYDKGTNEVFIQSDAVEIFEVRKDIAGTPQTFKVVTKAGREYAGNVKLVQNFERVYRKFGS